MLLHLLALAHCLGIDFKKRPRIIEAGKGVINCKDIGLYLTNNSLKTSEDLTKDSIYNFHLFLEKDFNPETISGIRKVEDKLYVSNIETEVELISLASFFYKGIFTKNNNQVPNKIVVSSRDYFDNNQNKGISQIFSNLGSVTRVVPESICMAAHLASSLTEGSSENIVLLNYRESQVTLSKMLIKKESGKLNISVLDYKKIEGLSDYKVESIISSELIELLQTEDPIIHLPYLSATNDTSNSTKSDDKAYYSCIEKLINETVFHINMKKISFNFLQLFYSREDEKKSFKDVKINSSKIRQRIESEEKIDPIIESLKTEDSKLYFASNFIFRSFEDFIKIDTEAVFKGAFLIEQDKCVFEDKRSFNVRQYKSSNFIKVEYEISTVIKCQEIIKNIYKEIPNFKYVTDFSEIKTLINNYNSSSKMAREIVGKWESLRSFEDKEVSKRQIVAQEMKFLEDLISSSEKDPLIKERINDSLISIKKWVSENSTK